MGLKKRNYTDKETVITAENLNDIQDAIIAMEDGLFVMEDVKRGEAITLTDASNRAFRSFSIFGKTTQNGTPTPDAPVELVSVGDSGSITVNVTGDNKSQKMTVETTDGLTGIRVASGGNYIDANGQRWICDEIDLARGVKIKRLLSYTLTGSEALTLYTGSNVTEVGNIRVEVNDLGLPAPPDDFTKTVGACSHFNYMVTNVYPFSCWAYKNAELGTCQLRFVDTLERFPSMNDFAEYVKTQYQAGTPIVIMYELETPIETPLTDAEISAYTALHTYKDHTEVSNDAGAWMELEYVMDSKKYIDGMISAAILEATVE